MPLFWIYLASQLYGKTGAVTGPVAVFIGTGILVSYWGLLLIASWIRARTGRRPPARPSSTTARPGTAACATSATSPARSSSDPIERLFVATAIVSIIGFMIWFAFFAGAPFPTQS